MDAAIKAALAKAAQTLGMQETWLHNVIALESAWNPYAVNAISGAVGLIQFMPRTLMGMGILSPALAEAIPDSGGVPPSVKDAVKNEFLAKYPTAVAQLTGPVIQYLRSWKPFPTEQSAYMAVFYPAYRYVSPDTLFPEHVRAQNPGIFTVSDYVSAVKKKSSGRKWWQRLFR